LRPPLDERREGALLLMVHGSSMNDLQWRMARSGAEPAPRVFHDHGRALMRERDVTLAYVHYNSGRHVKHNGDDLAALIEREASGFDEIILVGHSMGGLVARSACHYGTAWTGYLSTVFCLGSPHLGAPLEIGAATATRALRKLPETKPLGDALASRSAGIKDLRYGDVLEADWSALADLDDPRDEPDTCAPLLDGAEHYFVGATIGARHDTPVARILGDALVPFASASGTGRRRTLGLDVDRGRHLGGLHHFDLLNHPRVYAVLREWLAHEGQQTSVTPGRDVR
jgi:pimeloyl-ACP methyl ester carboxylesterase